MSVLKNRRNQSKAEFCTTARKIKVETRAFLSRLSARYARLDAADVMHLAREVADCTEEANSMMPTDQIRYDTRLELLLRARAALSALDADLLDVYDTLMKNPEGAFTTAGGRTLEAKEAVDRLDYMADTLGCLIADEEAMLTAVMKSDKQMLKKKLKEKAEADEKPAAKVAGARSPDDFKLFDRYMNAIGSGAILKEAVSVEEFFKIMEEHDERQAVKILIEMSEKYKSEM